MNHPRAFVAGGTRTLITGGNVISMDPGIGDLDRGDVLLENDVIVDVAEHFDASDAVVIDASDRVVMPGFVDTHRHARRHVAPSTDSH